ncbi:indole-3-glycerol phosphate synthase TrpC [Kandleria sp.]|uniref:indole-3-glycerol phosphate synthase TrpC n=1 Tax=Kandleria sp. TaxID=2774291 RepID=UPI001B6C42CE|nr:indole-3-glycerol phosphate synthase TrpC [Kandleria sp.]MBP3276758.1 indole-3-glycerol phosphate synthase TrpC [Kandleria sp.]
MILDDIVEKTKVRLEKSKSHIDEETMRKNALSSPLPKASFKDALAKEELSFILEVKKASPSTGLIAPDFPYKAIAKEYEAIGADAISVLTEPDFFLGDINYLKDISEEVYIPLLRKDFIIDPYMIDEARANGASAILLIVAILSNKQLKDYIKYAHDLSLDVLVEAHDEEEIKIAVEAGADIIGINNRNLKDFTVDQRFMTMSSLIPDDKIIVSESGISTREQVLQYERANALLIGETMMRSSDKQKTLNMLKGKENEN